MDKKLYNSDVKMEYLETQIKALGTRTTILHEFLKAADMERKLGKDIYAFHDVEISNLLKSMRRSNVMSIRKTLSILNSYVKWCIVNGKRGKFENQINYVEWFIETEEKLDIYVSNRQIYNKILNKEEFEDLLHIPINPMDQALILSLYELIGGEELYELRSIELKNIDRKAGQITLIGKDGDIRVAKISERLADLLEDVDLNVNIYISNNGELDSRGRINERKFAESKYVFKPIARGGNSDSVMSYQSILNRLKNIKNFSDYKHITANSIRETRIIHEILDLTDLLGLYEPNGEIYDEVVELLEEDYGLTLSPMQVYSIKQKTNQILNIKDFD